MIELPTHSPVGASGMSRWSVCPASVSLSRGIVEQPSSFAQEGTDAHTLAQWCLNKGIDAWECIGAYTFPDGEEIDIDKDMADAVQEYLNAVRIRHPKRHQGNSWVERSFHCKDIHPAMYGTSDLTVYSRGQRSLDVWDYKHGAGIVVDVQKNPQLMYYAVGMLEDLDLWGKVDLVTLHIAQPRGWHPDGAIRSWSITVADLIKWRYDVLLPTIIAASQGSDILVSGDHCRFCPARKRACPQLAKDMDELEDLMTEFDDGEGAEELSNEQIGRFLALSERAAMVSSAANEVAFHRLKAGADIPGRKLVSSRTNRAWKDGAEDAIMAAFGGQALAKAKVKSPAQIEKLAGGTTLAEEWAFKPEGKLTVAPESDKRTAVDCDTTNLFEAVE